MDVIINSTNVDMSSEQRARIDARIREELIAHESRIPAVTVFYNDVNGPRGGEDTRCALIVEGLPSSRVKVEVTAENVEYATDRALEQLVKVVRKEFDKRLDRRHDHTVEPTAET